MRSIEGSNLLAASWWDGIVRFSSGAAAEKRRILAGQRALRRSDIVVVPVVDEDDPTLLLTPAAERPPVLVRGREDPVWDLADVTEIEPECGPAERRPLPARRLPRLPSLPRPVAASISIAPRSSPWTFLFLIALAAALGAVAYFAGF